ncbi:sugar transferase [Sulfurimonas denitrificans DSM 1251]|uniref:Sugar transferase n=1 Tax=Sulfurimonas denitrificans (strain ATCC 33889 / DSM 1251) TaxID=326298 RepID=Q30PS2_SULDN|nr:sugar transferase [Sulfurimonas denitrificans]ABB45009.1 sugar transferase [Sulfurimonas denitrificans DSM 1251]MDD3442233.1 sugar transferase [Sulfurimonas denitrificans]
MLILGNKYSFTQLELERLEGRFKNIVIIECSQREQSEVLLEIEAAFDLRDFEMLVLNAKVKVSDEIMSYLREKQFKVDKSKLKIISVEEFMEEFLYKCYIAEESEALDGLKPYSTWQYMQKRAIDYFGVFWLFFFSWPVMLLCLKKIKEQSYGGVLFEQERVGLNGEVFRCTKFRTMHEGSHHDPYTRENDSRIFPFGNIMRRRRLDELPQMINILKGEMHLIGPRAEWDILVESYKKEIPHYNERHLVKPGITGWAQVNYPYGANIEDSKQKLMYDLYYIKHWSIGLELRVVYKTAMTVMGKKGL